MEEPDDVRWMHGGSFLIVVTARGKELLIS